MGKSPELSGRRTFHVQDFGSKVEFMKLCLGPAWFLNCPWNHEHFQSWFARLWNHKLKPFLQANIIEGIKLYGDKGNEWDDIITFIKNRYVFTSEHPKSPPIQPP